MKKKKTKPSKKVQAKTKMPVKKKSASKPKKVTKKSTVRKKVSARKISRKGTKPPRGRIRVLEQTDLLTDTAMQNHLYRIESNDNGTFLVAFDTLDIDLSATPYPTVSAFIGKISSAESLTILRESYPQSGVKFTSEGTGHARNEAAVEIGVATFSGSIIASDAEGNLTYDENIATYQNEPIKLARVLAIRNDGQGNILVGWVKQDDIVFTNK